MRIRQRQIARILVLWLPFLAWTAWRPWPTSAQILACVAWACFLTCHIVVGERYWIWHIPALMPPFTLAAVSLVLAAAALGMRGAATGPALVLAASSLVAGWPENGLNLAPLIHPRSSIPPGETIRIVAWNTQYWYTGTSGPDCFYQYLASLGADVYLLQEYIVATGNGTFRELDDDQRLRAAFPDYHVAIKGQLVTISRLPIKSQPFVGSTEVSRVDLGTETAGHVLSTYNVHIPVQVPPMRPANGYLRELCRRSRERQAHVAMLVSDLRANRAPTVVAGDFNATSLTGDLRPLRRCAVDAARSGGPLYPVSWHAGRWWLSMWRLDWMFLRGGVTARRYRLARPGVRSDHRVQIVNLRIPNV